MKIARSSSAVAVAATPERLLYDVRELILATREIVAHSVNSVLVLHYWQIGHRIRKDILQEKRAEYGQEILQTLSAKLVPEFGRSYAQRNT